MNVDPRRYPNVNIRALETDDDVKAHATPNEDNTMLYRMFEDAWYMLRVSRSRTGIE